MINGGASVGGREKTAYSGGIWFTHVVRWANDEKISCIHGSKVLLRVGLASRDDAPSSLSFGSFAFKEQGLLRWITSVDPPFIVYLCGTIVWVAHACYEAMGPSRAAKMEWGNKVWVILY